MPLPIDVLTEDSLNAIINEFDGEQTDTARSVEHAFIASHAVARYNTANFCARVAYNFCNLSDKSSSFKSVCLLPAVSPAQGRAGEQAAVQPWIQRPAMGRQLLPTSSHNRAPLIVS